MVGASSRPAKCLAVDMASRSDEGTEVDLARGDPRADFADKALRTIAADDVIDRGDRIDPTRSVTERG